MMGDVDTPVEFPEKLQFLFEKHRYKVAHGGRGGAKSWGFARALLLIGCQRPLRVLCTREFQNSIKDSVYQLLKDQVAALGLTSFYDVTGTQIVGKNGTRFGFEGLHHNINNIKSWEGADVCWVEEAHVVSKASWDILIPTIRKEGSEIWVSFNPDLVEDDTYLRFVVNSPPESTVVKINWRDNPWFPEVLNKERLHMKEKDPIAYDNVWEGNPRAAVEGAIFARQLARAQEDGKITDVDYDPNVPVNTYWDLGKRGFTAIWFAQYVAMEWRILRHYSNFNAEVDHYAEYVNGLPYTYGVHYLPHDAEQNKLGMVRSLRNQFSVALVGGVDVVPRVGKKATSIAAAMSIFPDCRFDKTLCAEGLSHMRRYCFAMDPQTGKISTEPKGDMYSHSSDAFQCFAMAAVPELVVEHRPYVDYSGGRLTV